jgi:hypothetical protein
MKRALVLRTTLGLLLISAFAFSRLLKSALESLRVTGLRRWFEIVALGVG